MILHNKNILIGVTGSIAIYKTIELIRRFVKEGANVKVMMSDGAKEFIMPLTFEAISGHKILDKENESWEHSGSSNHIAIGKWADIFIIAPATANTINKLSNGIADNLLLQTALAYPRIKLIAPAANTNMIENPITQASLKMLALCNFLIVQPISKELACRDVGNGAMAEVEDIFDATVQQLCKSPYWENRLVVMNGGATIEKIDDVRYISNFSSGKMASALARALYYKGADVCLVGSSDFKVPKGVHVIKTTSTQEMERYVVDSIRIAKKGKLSNPTLMDRSSVELIQKKPYFFGVAAVSDYGVKYPQKGKLKKDMLGSEWNLTLTQNNDILANIQKEGIYTIGFKAEFDQEKAQSNALMMLKNKSIDGVCLNILGEENQFGSDTNKIKFLSNQGEFELSGEKFRLSFGLLENLEKVFCEK